MQAQATGSRRFGLNRTIMLALALALATSILAIAAAALVLNDTVDLPFTSESRAVSSTESFDMSGRNRTRFLEQNVQLPDGILTAPAESLQHFRFLEQNTQLPAGIVTRPAQSLDHMRFLEQNLWGPTDDSENSAKPDDYFFLEEYLAGLEPDDARSTAPGIHRDEGLNAAPDE